jgi:polar amino acid transport system permease protein
MAQGNPPLTEPRQLIDVRVFARNILARRSWLIAFILFDIILAYLIIVDPILRDAWDFIAPSPTPEEQPVTIWWYLQAGIGLTLVITLISFVFSIIGGLFIALMRISKNPILYNISTFYVELFRGLPLLVVILIFNFALVPMAVDIVAGTQVVDSAGNVTTEGTTGIDFLDDLIQRLVGVPEDRIGSTRLRSRDIDETWRIIFAFAVTYAAFMSEVFRAGIESIGKGQMEASRSLGMNYLQAMRFIILPQAIRNILPALANNFILLLKDTSLASAVAVPEISFLTRQYASNRFRYPEGLLVLSFIYANLTIALALGVNWLEARLQADKREST